MHIKFNFKKLEKHSLIVKKYCQENNMKNKRVFYYDALRSLAIFGIIACHMTANFITNTNNISIYNLDWMFLLFFNSFRQFSIPIFVMISGALLSIKIIPYQLSSGKNLIEFLFPIYSGQQS